jgi:hypothetical protein
MRIKWQNSGKPIRNDTRKVALEKACIEFATGRSASPLRRMPDSRPPALRNRCRHGAGPATTAARLWICSPDAVSAGQKRLLHWKEGPAASSPRRRRCSS